MMKPLVLSVVILLSFWQESLGKNVHNTNKDLQDECGISGEASQFILGGEVTKRNQFPWMVALIMHSTFDCSGYLISDEWLVTTRSCAQRSDNITVLLGAYNVTEWNDDDLKLVSEVVLHEQGDNPIDNNIALIRLANKVDITDSVRPICLPTRKDQNQDQSEMDGVNVTVVGWGEDPNQHDYERILQTRLDTRISLPEEYYPYCHPKTHPSVVCTYAHGDETVCWEDYGGPLMIQKSNGRWTALGTISFFWGGSCYDVHPNGHTRTTSVLDWISETTGIEIQP